MCIDPRITIEEWNRISTLPPLKDSPEAQVEALTVENDILRDALEDAERELRYSKMEADALALGFSRTIAQMMAETNPANATDIGDLAGRTVRMNILQQVTDRFLAVTRECVNEVKANYDKENG